LKRKKDERLTLVATAAQDNKIEEGIKGCEGNPKESRKTCLHYSFSGKRGHGKENRERA